MFNEKNLYKDLHWTYCFFLDEILCPHRWPWHLVPVPQQLLAPSTSWLLQFILGVKVLNPFARVLPSGLDIGVQKCCIFIFLCNPFSGKKQQHLVLPFPHPSSWRNFDDAGVDALPEISWRLLGTRRKKSWPSLPIVQWKSRRYPYRFNFQTLHTLQIHVQSSQTKHTTFFLQKWLLLAKTFG